MTDARLRCLPCAWLPPPSASQHDSLPPAKLTGESHDTCEHRPLQYNVQRMPDVCLQGKEGASLAVYNVCASDAARVLQ